MRLIDPTLVALELDRQPLHSGLDGTVVLGEFGAEKVAVKRFAIRNSQSVVRFEREAKVLELETLRNIVRPLGIVRTPPHYWLVLPYFDHGDLARFSEAEENLSIGLALCLCTDAADALLSVHEAGLVFRDFKSGNVLINSALQARLTDFGSIQDLEKGIVREENEMGPSGGFHKRLMEGTTLLYAAPEVVSLESRNELDQRSDVYSFGITMCELLTKQLPYSAVVKDIPAMNTVMDATYNEQSLLSAICVSNLRPPMDITRYENEDADLLEAWKNLIRACWEPSKEHRPTMTVVLATLKDLLVRAGIKFDLGRACLLRRSSSTKVNANGPVVKVAKTSYPPAPSLDIVGLQTNDPEPISIGSFATSGRRGPDKMEDRHTVTHAKLDDGRIVTVIVILDGHGGQGTASFAHRELGPAIHNGVRIAKGLEEEKIALRQAFLETDARFQALYPDDISGSTALAVLIFTKDSKIDYALLANAGDCRAVVAERTGNIYIPVRLTNDHNADQAVERSRVIAAGGKIVKDALGVNRIAGHIQVTRSLGDNMMKAHGLTAEPEIDVFYTKPGKHDFLVIGTDGLFDFMTDDEVVRGVLDTAKEPGLASKRLGSESISKGSTDNVTSIVVFMREWSKSGKADWQ